MGHSVPSGIQVRLDLLRYSNEQSLRCKACCHMYVFMCLFMCLLSLLCLACSVSVVLHSIVSQDIVTVCAVKLKKPK